MSSVEHEPELTVTLNVNVSINTQKLGLGLTVIAPFTSLADYWSNFGQRRGSDSL